MEQLLIVEARLDRFLFCGEWAVLYPHICQIALTKPTSEHCPILLDSGNERWGIAPLRFELSWHEVDSFPALVQKWWQDMHVDNWAGFKLAWKLKMLNLNIMGEWNRLKANSTRHSEN